jgi:hypothetical protein
MIRSYYFTDKMSHLQDTTITRASVTIVGASPTVLPQKKREQDSPFMFPRVIITRR